MIAVLQRVKQAAVHIEGRLAGACEEGLMILLGVATGDEERDVDLLVPKIAKLRIFEDENGKMNRSVIDVDGEILVVSNFTLLANYKKGNRPDYMNSADPETAKRLYELFILRMAEQVRRVESGEFGADMQVSSVNDGPVTLILDTKELLETPRRG